MLNDNDLNTLQKKGITEDTLNRQLERFTTGFPYLKIASSAVVGNGITSLSPNRKRRLWPDGKNSWPMVDL